MVTKKIITIPDEYKYLPDNTIIAIKELAEMMSVTPSQLHGFINYVSIESPKTHRTRYCRRAKKFYTLGQIKRMKREMEAGK